MKAFCAAALFATTQAAIEQVHITYTGVPAKLAVDFVASNAGPAAAYTSIDGGKTWKENAATTFNYPTIGYMSQAELDFTGVAPGAEAQYFLEAAGENTTAVTVTPVVAGPEKFAVYGGACVLADFGIANDVCLTDLVTQASKGAFDSVLHVGDWAYNFEDAESAVGNAFMEAISGYAATHPIMPAEGNHERCTACPGVDALGEQNTRNFTQYKARFRATSLLGAGKTSGTNTARYYSFNQGLTHFIVFSAEAYLYSRDEGFLANQVAFMKADLAAVDRTATPWVVALVHKDWTMEAEAYAAFSPVLQEAKVDVLFCGHVHYYNRYMPFDPVTNKVDTAAVSADGSVYRNAAYMTTIVTGASGDREDDSKYTKESPSFTGSQNYGWGIFSALNATHATWNWHTVKADGPGAKDFSDSLTWIKNM